MAFPLHQKGSVWNIDNRCNYRKEMYRKAFDKIMEMVKTPTFIVFSEDIDYAKGLDLPGNLLFVDENNPDYEELRLMYSCRHFIISNSTFSWWAQYLTDNESRIVVAPSRWNNSIDRRNEDIYMDDWILVDV